MKTKKVLKYVVPAVGVAALATSLPLALTSCSNDSNTLDVSKDVQWSINENTTYYISKNAPQMPILNGAVKLINGNFSSATITYQWYKNSLPITNGQDANNSQYVVPKDNGIGNYNCVARISYNNKTYTATSPVFIVTNNPVVLTVNATPSKQNLLSNFVGQLQGFGSTLNATLTSMDANLNLKELAATNSIKYEWHKKGLFGDTIVSYGPTFTPTSWGLYYCTTTIISNGQYVTNSSGYKLILPNAIQASLASNVNNYANGNYYLDSKNTSFTLTPSVNKYMGKPVNSNTSVVPATMWLQKTDNGPFTINNNKFTVVHPMANSQQQMTISKPGDYIFVEAMYPTGTTDFTNYATIQNFYYQEFKVLTSQKISIPGIDSITSPQMQQVQRLLANVNNINEFSDPTNLQGIILKKEILKTLGLTNEADVSFKLGTNPGPSHGANTPASYYQVTLTFTALPGYEIVGQNQMTFATGVQGTTVLQNFTANVQKVKQQIVNNLNTAGSIAKLENDLKSHGTIYQSIAKLINSGGTEGSLSTNNGKPGLSGAGKPASYAAQPTPNTESTSGQGNNEESGSSSTQGGTTQNPPASESPTTPNFPANSYTYEVELSPNPGKNAKYTAKLVLKASPGYSFDNNIMTTYTLDLGQLNYYGSVQNLNKFKVPSFVLPLLKLGITSKFINQDWMAYLLSTDVVPYAMQVIFGWQGKASYQGPAVWTLKNGKYSVSYTFKSNDTNKWAFGFTNKPSTTITIDTGLTKLPPNVMNQWISVNPVTQNSVTITKGQSTTLSVSATNNAPQQIRGLFKLKYQWQQLETTPSAGTGSLSGKAGTTQQWVNCTGKGNDSPTFTVSPSQTTQYRCQVSLYPIALINKPIGYPVYSDTITVTVNPTAAPSGPAAGSEGNSSTGSTASGSSTSTPGNPQGGSSSAASDPKAPATPAVKPEPTVKPQ